MVQNISNDLELALAQTTTYLCRIWELTCDNGEVFRFTDLTEDIVYDGETYKYDPGIRVSSIVITSGGQPDNAQIEVVASENFLPMARIRNGGLSKATFKLWVIDWRDPDFYGALELFGGMTSTIKFNNKNRVSLSVNSDNGEDAQSIGERYSRQCRAQLGDERCKVNLEALKIAFTVDTITDNGYGFTAPELVGVTDARFKFGRILWTSGFNDTLQDEVKESFATGRAVMSLYPRNPVVPGDTGFIYPGCDFQVSTCGDKFGNLVNFRGEPYVPPPNIIVFSGLSAVTGLPNVDQNFPPT